MVAILEKGEFNVDFHPMVDFIKASPLRFALTVKPTVYVSHIRQFWSTARIETTDEGTQILATVDGISRTVTESSLRRNLKLQDEEGISSLPDTELFENLTLMGYNISPNQKFTFQKGQFSHQWKYLIHTIMQCLSPKSTWFNEFSSKIATALVCLATNRTYNFSKMIFDGLVKNVNNKVSKFLMYPSPSFSGRIVTLFDAMLVQQGKGSGTPTEPHHTPSPKAQPPLHTAYSSSSLPPVTTTSIPTVTPSDTTPIRQYTRRTRIAQSPVPPTIANKPASPQRDVSQGEACPTDTGFIADQDRATINKSSTLPHDSAPRVTSPAAVEGSMQQTIPKLTALCTSLQRQLSELTDKFQAQEVEINQLNERVKLLEEREGAAATKSRDDALIKGRSMDEGEAATERVSDDTEEMATILTSMDAATVLASGVVDVPTSSRYIPTVSTPVEGLVPTGSEEVPTASPVFSTATVVTPVTRRKGKEREDQRRVEQIARDAEIARIHAEEELQKLPMERRIELISDLVKYQDNYTKIYKFQSQQRKLWTKKQKRDYYMAVIRNTLGWKVKDFRGITFEEVEAKFNSVWKQMEDFIPMGSKEEAERIKRKGINLEQESAKKQKTSEEVTEEAKSPEEVLEEKVKEMMQLVPIEEVGVTGRLQGWETVQPETLSNRPPTSDKEIELWVELNRMYEPDKEDQLWTHTQNFMHALVDWKLYDSCGVHHVTSKDKEIFMLVEKD
nr:synaptobrevin, longin-like domain protein [Tanacetum cinerariifolium]